MMGQLIFHYCLLYILIDSGATPYFVASDIVERIQQELTLVSHISIEMLVASGIQVCLYVEVGLGIPII